LINPLATFSAAADKYGGYIELDWTYPTTQVTNWQLYVFKRQGSTVTADEIKDYFDGKLTDEQLKAAGIWVFRDIPKSIVYNTMKDFTVEIGKTYYYIAVIWDLDGKAYSAALSANAKPDPQLLISVVDGKALVARAIEKVIDAIKTATGDKPDIQKNIKVLMSYAEPKGDDFFAVVSRGAGQVAQRTLSLIYTEFQSDVVKGESDLDTISVEWLTYLPKRRDQFTNLMRVMRPLMYRYLMAMGNGDVYDIRFIMGGDSQKGEGDMQPLMRGTMTVVLVIKNQLQIGGARTFLPYLIYEPSKQEYDEQGVFNAMIVHEGNIVRSDGTNGWFMSAGQDHGTLAKVTPAKVATEYSIDLCYPYDMCYAFNRMYIYGLDTNYNDIFGYADSSGTWHTLTIPSQYATVYPTQMIFDGISLWMFATDYDANALDIFKIDSNNNWTLFKQTDFTYINDALYFNNIAWAIGGGNLLAIDVNGNITTFSLNHTPNRITLMDDKFYMIVIDDNNHQTMIVTESGGEEDVVTDNAHAIANDGTVTWQPLMTERNNGGDVLAFRQDKTSKKYTLVLPTLDPPYYYAFNDIIYANDRLWLAELPTFSM
jgi:hypothetical protein